jgi:hypothetical protein
MINNENNLHVKFAAIKYTDGYIYAVPRPGRHHTVIGMMADYGHPTPIKGEQGFILSDGTFADRQAAKIVAKKAKQLLPRASKSDELFSEDLW